MNERPIATKQFVRWFAVTAVAVFLWVSFPKLIGLSVVMLGLASFILVSKGELDRPLKPKPVCTYISIFAAGVVGLVTLSQNAPVEYKLMIDRMVEGPWFILPAWAFGVWRVYRRWRS
jgi:hypothetical protein